MKKIIIAAAIAVVSLFAVVIATKRAQMEDDGKDITQTLSLLEKAKSTELQTDGRNPSDAEANGERDVQQIPSKEERLRMPRHERLALLEGLGCLPYDADWSDFEIGDETSWWGRRLDPEVFWKDKVVWLDGTAVGTAWRYGRSYPPMPYEDLSVQDRSDEDLPPSRYVLLESPNFHLVSSQRESAFWGKFVKTHPIPPRDIIHWQTDRADRWLDDINILSNRPDFAARLGITESSRTRTLETDRRDATPFGYPPECISPEAYRWAHIMKKRKEYAELQASGGDDDWGMRHFLRGVYVDPKYITEPLSEEDLRAANAWKVEYLRRLRAEKTDESYINAYMQAWSLSSNEVFGAESVEQENGQR